MKSDLRQKNTSHSEHNIADLRVWAVRGNRSTLNVLIAAIITSRAKFIIFNRLYDLTFLERKQKEFCCTVFNNTLLVICADMSERKPPGSA